MGTGVPSGVEAVQAGLAQLNAADVTGLPDAQVRAEVLALVAIANQVHAALAARVDSFDVRDLAHADALRTSSTWLVDFANLSKGAAQRLLAHGRWLRQLPALAAGARAGTVSAEQLARIGDLVQHVGVEQVRPYDEILATLCAHAGPVKVAEACSRILAYLDPDGPEPDPADAFGKREIVFSQLGQMMYIRGKLDPEGAAALRAAVEALMRPPTAPDGRTAPQRRADAMVDLARGALAGDHLPAVGGERPNVGLLITPEILFGTSCSGTEDPAAGQAATEDAPTERVGQAATEDATADQAAVGTGCAHGGDGPHGTAAPDGCSQRSDVDGVDGEGAAECDCDALARAGVPPLPERPWLNWVGTIPTETAQRLACDSVVWRVVLDPRTGLPLDVGRKHRLVPWWMRKALWARDRTCRWPGCDVPCEWTDAHHVVPWWHGGTTEISKTVSLCRYHHGLVHDGRWKLRLDLATGEIWVTRPDGSPYELGPSRPWTTPSHQGPRPGARPRQTPPPDTS